MRIVEKVPFGYEPPKDGEKGTLIFYDTFEHITDEQLDQFVACGDANAFAALVLYPLHEETFRRMSKEPVSPYYKREKRLEGWIEETGNAFVAIDGWEGKRKKYTPIDAALRHLTETLEGPFFLVMSPDMANRFASYDSFKGWIVKLRLKLLSMPGTLHPRLEEYRSRWDFIYD